MKKDTPTSRGTTDRRKTDPDALSSTDTARLVVLAGDKIGRRYTVQPGATLGRSSEATILFDDGEVSRKHARIERDEDGHFSIVDLGSRNGTTVNGVPAQRHTLSYGDKIQLGPNVLLLFSRFDENEEQILQRQRLEALGRLTAGVVHDFNNMLGAMTAALDFLERMPADKPLSDREVRECLHDVRVALEKATDLTPRLMSFARSERQGHARVSLSTLCREIAQLARRTFGRQVRVEESVADDLAVVGDSAELHQVLMNLCLNARDAMPEGGVLAISAERHTQSSMPSLANDGPYAVVKVTDSGIGMTAETRARIFEPFFSTKKASGGSGLGLATAWETVQVHGGTIEVDSNVGKGSVFRIVLPSVTEATDQKRRRLQTVRNVQPPAALRRGGGRVLLVDDEDVVRRSFGRLLRAHGFETIEARSGSEAVRVYAEQAVRPELVVLDLDMPEGSGEEAAQVMRTLDPTVRVLIISGHADQARERALLEQGASGFLRKPCGVDTLLQAVFDAMQAPVGGDRPTTETEATLGPDKKKAKP